MDREINVLVEAREGKHDGIAFLPLRGRTPVRSVGKETVLRELPSLIGKEETEHLRALLQLREAVEGKSGNREQRITDVVRTSRVLREAVEESERLLERHGKVVQLPKHEGKQMTWMGSSRIVAHEGPVEDEATLTLISLLRIKRNANRVLDHQFTDGVRRACLCLYEDRAGSRQVGLFCPDVVTALYATSIVGDELSACLRDGQLFARDRVDDQFCSPRCKATYLKRIQRSRERQRRR